MAASVSRSRLLEFTKLQCTLFSSTFNPTHARLGNKVLRQRLKGPTIASYYPRKSATVDTMLQTFKEKFGLDGWNEFQEDRKEGLEIAKMRGKGAPKKIRSKDEGGVGKKKKGKR